MYQKYTMALLSFGRQRGIPYFPLGLWKNKYFVFFPHLKITYLP